MSIISAQGHLGDTFPTIGAFNLPTKTVGDAAFTITPPTSSSTVAWVLESSNTAVISLSGTTATVVGAGSSTITATQPWSPFHGKAVATATCVVAPQASDQYWGSVALLCHFDGSPADQKGNTPTDHSTTYSGTAKFNSSMYMDATARYVTFPYSASLIRWTDTDYTIEMWINHVANRGANASQPLQVGHMQATGGSNYWSFGIASSGKVCFYYFNGSQANLAGGTVVSAGWHHIAFTRTGTTLRLFLDGVLDGSQTQVGTPQFNAGIPLTIGGFSNVYANDYIDDLRITYGVSRYTSNFTVTSSPFPNQ
jgi:hypothetical protein